MKNDNTALPPMIPVVYEGIAPQFLGWNGPRLLVSYTKRELGTDDWSVREHWVLTKYGADGIYEVSGSKVNLKSWPDAPHAAFANLDLSLSPQSLKRVESFLRTYGISNEFIASDPESGAMCISINFLKECQRDLRGMWENHPSSMGWGGRNADIVSIDGRLQVRMHELWPFICVSFLRDRENGRTQRCKYDRCDVEPYFLKSRRDQEFCSKGCRARYNMELWRADPQNRKRENARRRKPRQKRSTRK